MSRPSRLRSWYAQIGTLLLTAGLWFWPVPDGLTLQAWHLFALFAGAIGSVVAGALPILPASVLAGSVAVLAGVIRPAAAWGGFANGTILLIVIAFLVARAVVKCGLGERIGHAVASRFGRSTLGLAYSLFLVDAVIAPAFPSNTARSGVLYPLAASLAQTAGAQPGDPAKARLGGFLMFSGIASLSLSSGLWLTAMAANPLGTEIARKAGVEIGFGLWLLVSSVPTLVAMAVLPFLLYKVMRPEVTATPGAPAAARAALAALGPLKRDEWIVTITFVVMVTLLGAASVIAIDATAVAFFGLAVFMITGVLTPQDREGRRRARHLHLVRAALHDEHAAERDGLHGVPRTAAVGVDDWRPRGRGRPRARARLRAAALPLREPDGAPAGALRRVPGRRLKVGVPLLPLSFLLLFATNFFSAITPQGSSANLLFAASGYPLAARAVPTRRVDHGVQSVRLSRHRRSVAAARRALMAVTGWRPA